MSTKTDRRRKRQKLLVERFGPVPTPAKTERSLATLIEAIPTGDACDYAPGTWQPPAEFHSVPETESDGGRTLEPDVDDADKTGADEVPFALGLADWARPVVPLLDHGPDPAPAPADPGTPEAEDDPFADLIAAAELVVEEESRASGEMPDPDPDLRVLIAHSFDSTVMLAMALGDPDYALAQHVERGESLRAAAERIRARLPAQAPPADTDEALGQMAIAPHLRRVIAALSATSLGLTDVSRDLEQQALAAGTAYRQALTAHRDRIERCQSEWPRLSLAVLLHQAAKPEASASTRTAFRAAVQRILADKKELDEASERRVAAEQGIHSMHATWIRGRNHVLDVRRKLGNVRAACQLFELDPEPFEATIAAAEDSCRRSLEEIDGHKALVSIEPISFSREVGQILASLPKAVESLDRLDRVGEQELADLMLIAFGLVRSTRSPGRAPKTVARMLRHGGLVEERDEERANAALRELYSNAFSKVQWRRSWVWVLTEDGITLAERVLSAREDIARVTDAVAEGRRIVNEQQRETRQRLARAAEEKRTAAAAASNTP
ncbi:hypothetical protein A2304_00025 [Candidatus Uhrbacteria bacterium RIFOXYB2_FULL_57_15]|uniref:Uncharacterized protein n=1 Tax=Candidatus Uhrbacteria bacterium RIFOXYB2_FULL_57_15 TaxID=1802422 RepID=A0A1F7W991_9BACT|nr:MAG: hypothetical protein A2304_00025 [Candidatus Uhrbacteria bacterium RIFOXYB2_FULL_57_15]OGM00481.1 MAG: hypothetical protein A2501_00775 [Candidatus Uhrbacteria bacterium RIFOXYC12_FULL_57_11]